MQVNQANQAADFNLPVSNNSEKSEKQAAAVNRKKTSEETRDQVEIKEGGQAKNAAVKQNTSLKFSRDQQTDQLVVELVDNQTGESVRQIPSEVSLKLTAIYAKLNGALIDKKY